MPTYERREDRDKELALIEAFCRYARRDFEQMPPGTPFDAILFSEGKVSEVLEVKNRTHLKDRTRLEIDQRKLDTLLVEARGRGARAVLVVSVNDPSFLFRGFIVIDGKLVASLEKGIIRRMDRGDVRDIDPGYFIPLQRFNTF